MIDTVPLEEDGTPRYIQLTTGKEMQGRDGRILKVRNPKKVISNFKKSAEELFIDIDHNSLGWNGGTESYGWVKALEARGDEIWAEVEWTEEGADLIRSKKFRSISPVFEGSYDEKDPTGMTFQVESVFNIALTNMPNLRVKSLNREETQLESQDKPGSTIIKNRGLMEELLELLNANDEQHALNRVKELLSLEGKIEKVEKDLERMVPRPDYDLMKNKLSEAEEKLKKIEKDAHQEKVNAALDGAVKAGKIAPASVDYHRACMNDAEGLARFERFIGDAAPLVELGKEMVPAHKPAGSEVNLSPNQLRICESLKIDPVEYAKNYSKRFGNE